MSEPGPAPASEPFPLRRFLIGALGVGAVSAAVFAFNLAAEPDFVDEWAYFSQAYFADLFFQGKFNHPAWLEYPAYDLTPLPKYPIGAALRIGGFRVPGPAEAASWYENTSRRFGPHEALVAARIPTVLFGVMGCLAVYGLGTLTYDRRAGVLSAIVLAINPLYRLLARRAMSDVPAESMLLVATFCGLLAWQRFLTGGQRRSAWLLTVAGGIAAGLAPLAKLNGALGPIILIAWASFALVLPGFSAARKAEVVLAAVLAGAVALATFIALDPFLTAHPRAPLPAQSAVLARMSLIERMRVLLDQRVQVSRQQQVIFAHNAVTSAPEKLKVVSVQGFGRFGVFGPAHSDSRVRYDAEQDLGALAWIPLVAAGVWVFVRRGRAQLSDGAPPTAWAVLIQAAIVLIAVTVYLPLAWDRYFLSLQATSALFGGSAVIAIIDGARRNLRLGPPKPGLEP